MKALILKQKDLEYIQSSLQDSELSENLYSKLDLKRTIKAVNGKGQIMGITSWKEIRSEVGFVLFTYVLPEYRRKGVLHFLIKARIPEMRNQGAKHIYSVVVWKFLVKFLSHKHGFKETVKFPKTKSFSGDLGYQVRMELNVSNI